MVLLKRRYINYNFHTFTQSHSDCVTGWTVEESWFDSPKRPVCSAEHPNTSCSPKILLVDS